MKPRNRKGFGASSFVGAAHKFRPNGVRISTCASRISTSRRLDFVSYIAVAGQRAIHREARVCSESGLPSSLLRSYAETGKSRAPTIMPCLPPVPRKRWRGFLHVAILYAARSPGSCIILCNRVVSQLSLLHHSLRLCRPAGLESSARLCRGRAALQMKTRHAARVKGQTGVCPVKDENTPCGV